MADKKVERKEKSSVISEIDQEISDIIDEEVETSSDLPVEEEKRPSKVQKISEPLPALKTEAASDTQVHGSPSKPEKISEHAEAKPAQEGPAEESELERDGIIIRKA